MKREIENPILDAVHRAALGKLAHDPVALDLRGLTAFTDYFYICEGESARQNRAIAEAVLEVLAEAGAPSDHAEGMEAGEWILVDAGDVIVHVFTPVKREFFSLERLWGDAARVALPEDG